MTTPAVTYNYTAYGPAARDQTDQNFQDLVQYISNRNSGSVAWDAVKTNYMDLVVTATASAPTAVQGRVYFNSDDLQVYVCKDGSTWSILG